jgi:hypothetical protein
MGSTGRLMKCRAPGIVCKRNRVSARKQSAGEALNLNQPNGQNNIEIPGIGLELEDI